MTETIERIPLDSIHPHPANRVVGGFDEAKLKQLAQSIAQVGVQQPAVVRPKDGGYELVAGERRWRASRIAGLDYLPCVIRELSDADTLKIQVIENLQREDVHPLDEADGYERLRRDAGYDVELIAQEVGRSPSYVYQRLRLQKLVPSARELLLKGDISVAHAVILARLEDELQFQVLKDKKWDFEHGISASDLDDWVRRNLLMELKDVAWKLADATLFPAAGACTACPKRTGADPGLFAELSADHCKDAVCFAAKETAIVARHKAELAGKEHLLVLDSWDWTLQQAGAAGPNKWEELKKKDSGAIPCLVLNGKHPGRLTWGKLIKEEEPEEDEEDGDEEEGDDASEPSTPNYGAKLREAWRETNARVKAQVIARVRALTTSKAMADCLQIIVKDILDQAYDAEDLAVASGLLKEEDVEGLEIEAGEEAIEAALKEQDVGGLLAVFIAEKLQSVGLGYPNCLEEELEVWTNFLAIDADTVFDAVREEKGIPAEPADEDDEE
jgi:ParB/RepB/Spo0J family partition protein